LADAWVSVVRMLTKYQFWGEAVLPLPTLVCHQLAPVTGLVIACMAARFLSKKPLMTLESSESTACCWAAVTFMVQLRVGL